MNIRPVSYINNSKGIGVFNQTKEAPVTVWCTVTGLTQILDTRSKFDNINIGAMGDRYKERFVQENPAN